MKDLRRPVLKCDTCGRLHYHTFVEAKLEPFYHYELGDTRKVEQGKQLGEYWKCEVCDTRRRWGNCTTAKRKYYY